MWNLPAVVSEEKTSCWVLVSRDMLVDDVCIIDSVVAVVDSKGKASALKREP